MSESENILKYVTAILLTVFVSNCSKQSAELRWQQEEGYQWAELSGISRGSNIGFQKMDPSDTGIRFKNNLPENDIVENRNYLNGSGVAAGDVNGDGLTDLYFAQLNGPNKLYENLGNFRFRDVTDSAGIAHQGYYSTGSVFADVDGDTDLDLIVTSMSKDNVLYINSGKGRFTKKDDS